MVLLFLLLVNCGVDLKSGDDKAPEGGAASSSSSSKTSNLKQAPPPAPATTESPAKPVPLDVRARFGANLFLLSGVELAHVILQLERECPEALEHLNAKDDPPRLEINVDAIPDLLFDDLSTYVEGRVGTRDGSIKAEDSRPKKKKKTA